MKCGAVCEETQLWNFEGDAKKINPNIIVAKKRGDYMQVTKHAKERMKERCGLNEKSVNRMANIAYEKGLKHSNLTGNLKKWADGQYLKNRTANQIRLYGDKAYIFQNKTLITVIQIPHNLVKEVVRISKKEG